MQRALNFLMVSAFSLVLATPIAYADDGPNAQCHVREKKKEKKKKQLKIIKNLLNLMLRIQME